MRLTDAIIVALVRRIASTGLSVFVNKAGRRLK